ncbi:galactoside O-acetyltransferase [Tritonibacter scottomollicae]|uniref:Chloramphenicol acetyltransferase n=2 Tax=Tritonibacter scottomollicae TaxID=483013 RepID=A0A2T1ACB9_TRISK|nr:galactoside O-acetyltransferase [Tritonibacter scottomollicae]
MRPPRSSSAVGTDMAYLTQAQLDTMGFASLGHDVKISDKASIYNAEQMTLGDHTRIDDFCVVSGCVTTGRNVHIAPLCLVAGGTPGIEFSDFSGLAYGVKIFAQSDDYSGATMTNPTVPAAFKSETKARVSLGRHVIVGANAVVAPGVSLADGTAVGAGSVVLASSAPWSIMAGVPAKHIKTRSSDLLALEDELLQAESH